MFDRGRSRTKTDNRISFLFSDNGYVLIQKLMRPCDLEKRKTSLTLLNYFRFTCLYSDEKYIYSISIQIPIHFNFE